MRRATARAVGPLWLGLALALVSACAGEIGDDGSAEELSETGSQAMEQAAAGAASPTTPADSGHPDDAGSAAEAVVPPVSDDPATSSDGGARDTGDATDPAPIDAGTDAGTDSGMPDAGTDAGTDSGMPDAGTDAGADSGMPDAGTPDAGVDAGPPDAGGEPDSGTPDAGTPPDLGEDLPLPTALTTYYVSESLGDDGWSGTLPEPNGSLTDGPRASLGAAAALLNGADPGTHVLLRRGDTWQPTGTVEISDAIGTEADPIVLGAYGEGAQPSIVSQHAGHTFTIRGSARGGTSYFRMHDLRLTAASIQQGQDALYLFESLHPEMPHHVTFSELTIENNATGITMYGNDHLVHGSRIANNTMGHGAWVHADNIAFRYTEFEHNGLPPPDTAVHSIYFSDCDGVLFEHNVVHTATDGVKARRTQNGIYRHNTFYEIEAIGIHLGGDSNGGANNNRIESNLFHDNAVGIVIKSESGIQTDPIDGLVIANNILHSSRVGFVEWGSHLVIDADVPAQNVWVVHNLLYDMDDDHGIHIGNGGANITCANNIVGKFTAGRTYNFHANVITSNNLSFTTRADFDTLGLVDPAGFDFQITASSTLLIDQGTDFTGVLDLDYVDAPRPVGGGYDIGPYELQ